MASYVIPVYVSFRPATGKLEIARVYHFSAQSSADSFMATIRDIPGVLTIECESRPMAIHSACSAFELFTAERI
jgi:hypothetical protein